ncbi:MAG: DUF4397 domain-containing protein [Planctomycetota bacterium]
MLRTTFLSVAASALFALPALAQDSAVTVLHGIPGLGGPVDVVAGGSTLFTFDFGDQVGDLSLAPGPVVIDIQQNGTSLLSDTVNVPAGLDVSLIAHLDAAGTPVLSAFVNDTSLLNLPETRLTVRHTAQAGAVDIALTQGGAPVATLMGVTNGQESVNDIPPGTYEVEIFDAVGGSSVFGPAEIVLEDGESTSVFAVGVALQPSFGVLAQRDALTAKVTVVHGIPGLPNPVDVRNNTTTLFSFDFTDIVGPLVLNPGSYNLNVQLNGAPVAGLSLPATLAAGDDLSIVAHLDATGANTLLSVFANDVTPSGNRTRVTARHLAAAPTVDVILDRNGSNFTTITGLSNATGSREASADIGPAFYDLSIAATAGGPTVFGPAVFTPVANTSTTFYAIGDFNGGSFTVVSNVIDLAPAVPGDLSTTTIGTGCGPTIGLSTPSPMFGSVFEVNVSGGIANGMAMLNIGDSLSTSAGLALPFDLGGFGAPGCFVNTNVLAPRMVALDGMGNAEVPVIIPNIAFGTLPTLYFQSVVSTTSNALGVATSEALELTPN